MLLWRCNSLCWRNSPATLGTKLLYLASPSPAVWLQWTGSEPSELCMWVGWFWLGFLGGFFGGLVWLDCGLAFIFLVFFLTIVLVFCSFASTIECRLVFSSNLHINHCHHWEDIQRHTQTRVWPCISEAAGKLCEVLVCPIWENLGDVVWSSFINFWTFFNKDQLRPN